MAVATKSKAAPKQRRARRPRIALIPRTILRHEFEPMGTQLTVGYLRGLVNGIPKNVPDNYVVELHTNNTVIIPDEEGIVSKSSKAKPVADVDDDDTDV